MKTIKDFLCRIGFHRWKYSFGALNLYSGIGYEWRDCKWCGKSEKVEF